MQKAQQAFLSHSGIGGVGHSMEGGNDGWLEGFLAHGQSTEGAGGKSLVCWMRGTDARL